ncbi:hypothetical protein SAMN02745824_2863 [Parasphingorhabdus marina DSM 22363]|uniref:DUF6456 domain-containing protein n=1 Tax=Parasphingorhabdus marina DSM 22363 TaxID=1123272 RepID=A0A1N6GJQ4_9SPHN|nr:hypothetical protein SAMN02745824_2863 [Parasphingorhabdus marina DSM 22363]
MVFSFLHYLQNGKSLCHEMEMPVNRSPKTAEDPSLLVERPVPQDGREKKRKKSGRSGRPARSVTVNLAESPLAWLHARGHLTDRQLDAGEKLREDWERAHMAPGITMNWSLVPRDQNRRSGEQHLEPSEVQISARQRFEAAQSALGKDLHDIAWRVICAGETVPNAERNLNWPARSGKIVLRIALDRLADFYRLPG